MGTSALLNLLNILLSGLLSWSPSEEKWDGSIISADQTDLHKAGNSIVMLSEDKEKRQATYFPNSVATKEFAAPAAVYGAKCFDSRLAARVATYKCKSVE